MNNQMSKTEAQQPLGLIQKVADRYSFSANELVHCLTQTVFRQAEGKPEITTAQMQALLIVCDQYGLNPFTGEIFAFPGKKGQIIPVVGVDGWNRIANDHSQFDGVEFIYSEEMAQYPDANTTCHTWIEAVLYRKDREHPIRVREYLDECYKQATTFPNGDICKGPWQTHPKRLLRHKAEIQCFRIGFGFSGIYDEDEAAGIIDASSNNVKRVDLKATVIPMNQAVKAEVSSQEAVNPVQTVKAEVSSQTVVNPVVDVKPHQKTFDTNVVDGFLQKVIKRAGATTQWQAGEELLEERFKGDVLTYALQEYRAARQVQPQAETQAEAQTEAEAQTVHHNVVMPDMSDADTGSL